MKNYLVFLILAPFLLLAAAVQEWTHYEYYEDLRAPASTITIGTFGLGNSCDRGTDGTLLFATNEDQEAYVVMQLPHSYKFGSVIEPHVHWAKSTSAAGDVCWAVDWECKDIGETFSNSPATVDMEYVVDDDDTAYRHAYADAGADAFDPGCSGVSCICKFRIWRDVDGGSCAALGDDYAADAILYEFDIHYLSDTMGSRLELSK